MSEYKENTVGWHLSRLKEPLRSRALANTLEEKALVGPIAGMWEAIHLAFPWSDTPEDQYFWAGVHNFFQGQGRKPNRRAGVVDGYDMAKECAPDPEEVNPPLDLVSTGLGVMDTGSHPRLTYEPMEVVEGYTPPRPVETIEGRHDREIKQLEAVVAQLEQKIEYIFRNLPKDFDGSR